MKDTDNPLRRNRHYLLSNLIKIAPIEEGHIAECGCWKGLSSSIIASELKNKNFKITFIFLTHLKVYLNLMILISEKIIKI